VAVLLCGAGACAGPNPSTPGSRTYPLSALPVERWTGGLPARGEGSLRVEVSDQAFAADVDWRRVEGTVGLTCDRCVLGDDRPPWFPPGSYLDGAAAGHLDLGTVTAEVALRGGSFELWSRWRSGEVELDAHVTGVLGRAAGDTTLTGCVRFGTTPTLAARDPKLATLLSLSGAPTDGAGRWTVTIGGTLDAARLVPIACEVPLHRDAGTAR